MKKSRNVNDNVHGLIRITNLESKIMSQEIFNRLHNVYQNSAAYLTWSSNRIQRFEHSIGCIFPTCIFSRGTTSAKLPKSRKRDIGAHGVI